MVLVKIESNRFNNCLKGRKKKCEKEQLYGLDSDLEVDMALDLEGSSQLLIPVRFPTGQVFQVRH